NDAVAWFGSEGNIALEGSCFVQSSCAEGGVFAVKNSSNDVVSYINSSGDLCIISGDCSDQSVSCNPVNDAFIVRNSSSVNMNYLDDMGDLCLKGVLYENADL